MASRLLNEMHQMMRRRHYSIRTEQSCCAWVRRYVHFHKMRSRAGLRNGEQKIETFLTHLAIDLQVRCPFLFLPRPIYISQPDRRWSSHLILPYSLLLRPIPLFPTT
ncbi:MAG: phage integrase N-terminal SAM-like domain-containing protein [Deltaproteobacteria bacterium]|nr:MAG: phage integrase N-terminal SAM-like domain-containing protein [Deltaproteobacteria bacterium]